MAQRTDLHAILVNIIGPDGGVYFQPPETISMKYPCVRYALSGINAKFADDSPYSHRRRYTITVIDRNPDSEIPMKIASLKSCVMNRCYTANNLNHYVFEIYF